MDEEWHDRLRRSEAAGRLYVGLATWVPLGLAVSIMLYFAWYLGDMHGKIEATQKCVDMVESSLGRKKVRPPGPPTGKDPIQPP